MGIILEGTFRVWPYPEREAVRVVGFKDYLTGLDALRRIMQAELRPSVVRLYDENESRPRIADFLEYRNHPCICILTFSGLKELVEIEERLALSICARLAGVEGSPEPAHKWMEHRYESLTTQLVFEGRMADTIEVAAPWTALPDIYEGMKDAVFSVESDAQWGAHWSHVYSDGACMYMTFIIPANDDVKAASQYVEIWERAMQACVKAGGTISHHHGVGYFRSKWLIQELGSGHNLLQKLKRAIDPNSIMNPGKLGLS
jgi:alkyldihydroxyacetonephosphate synthase